VRLRDVVLRPQTWNPGNAAADERFQYIDLASIDHQTKSLEAPRDVECGSAPSRARQLVREGDVLVSTVRPNLNAVAVVPLELESATASTGFCVLRPIRGRLDSRYLFHWVRTPSFVAAMVKRATGASYPAVSDRVVLDSSLPLVDLTEQRRVAGILDLADRLKERRLRAMDDLRQLRESIAFEMFGDPVRNSKGWPDGRALGEVAEVVSGVTLGRKVHGSATRKIKYLAVVNVQDQRLDLSTVKTIQATDVEIERYRLLQGDLLLTEGGDPDKLGRGCLWSGELPDCIHQNHIFRVRVHSADVTPQYLNWLVGSPRGKSYFLRSAKQTTGIASINSRQLHAFPLLLPPLQLQKEFGTTLGRLVTIGEQMTASRCELDRLFASLQHRAFCGDL
jgi:type I restriction enzyme S subunit